MERILRWSATVMAIAATALLAIVGIGPHVFGYRTYTVLTDSMRPTIQAGSVVIATPRGIDDVGEGDVVTYVAPVSDRRVVTHRVVDLVAPGVVRTKGDASDAADPWTARLDGPQVMTVRFAIPWLGRVVGAARTPWARSIATAVAPAVLAAIWLRRIWAPTDVPGDAPT